MAARFLELVREPGTCRFGTWAKLAALETLELLSHAGFDFIVVDMEHAPHTFETAYRTIVAAQGFGMSALVRLPDTSGSYVQRILDSGADGVLVPRVRSAEEARIATDAMIFSPKGQRGLGATSRAGRWGLDSTASYVDTGNTKILRAMQLEDPEALSDAGRIMDVEAVNALFVGLGDLSLVTGKPSSHPDNERLVTNVLQLAHERSMPCGTAVADAAAAKRAKERGFSFVMVSNDTGLFGRAASDLVKAIKD